MKPILKNPVSGIQLGAVLNRFPSDRQWTLRQVETITSQKALELGDLWKRSVSGPFPIRNADLITILEKADQVVELHLLSATGDGAEVLLEDGNLLVVVGAME